MTCAGIAEERNRPQIEGFMVGFFFSFIGLFFYQNVTPLSNQNDEERIYSDAVDHKNLKYTAVVLVVAVILMIGMFFFVGFKK